MKRKNLIFAVFAAIVVAAASCNKERAASPDLDGGIPAGTPMTITAGLDTKIYYQNGKNIRWTTEDKLRVFDDEGVGSTFTTQDGGKLEAEFTCDNWIGGTPVFAVHSYPQSLFKDYVYGGENAVTAYLSPSQSIVHKQSFSKYSILSVGTISESNGSYEINGMKNVFGSIGFILSSSGVKSVTLTGNNSEVLAGWVDVDYNNGKPTWKVSEAGGKETSKSIVATVNKGGAVSDEDPSFVKETSYYINVLPQTFEKGLTLTIEKQNGAKAVREISSEIVLARNEARSFSKALDYELPFDPLTIHFAMDVWPFEEKIVSKANQDKTGLTGETYTYKYEDGGESKSCEFVIANPASEATNNYYAFTAGSYLKFMDPGTGSWIKLPAIEGRKLCSVKVTTSNASNKTVVINTSNSGAEPYLFKKSVGNNVPVTYYNSELEYDTSYYIYWSNGKSCQLTDLELIYSK